jgi:FkbM family methyltransferase
MTARDWLNRLLAPAGLRLERRSRDRIGGRDLHGDIDIVLGRGEGYRILDLGANQGQSVRHFFRDFRRPEILSVEPARGNLEILRRRYGSHPRVRIVPAAMGETDGEAELRVYEQSEMNSLLPLEPSERVRPVGADLPVLETERVEVMTLDTLAAKNGLERIDLLKMDCQGAEMAILRGARRMLAERRITCICLEVMFQPLYVSQAGLEEYRAFLEPHGFALTGFYSPAFRQHSLFHADVLFVRDGRQA